MEKQKSNPLKIFIYLVFISVVCAILALILHVSNKNQGFTLLDLEEQKKIEISNHQSYINEQNNSSHVLNDFSYRMSYSQDYNYNYVHFLTSCEGWDNTKLLTVGKELFNNTHSDEIHYLEAVILEEGSGIYYSSNYESIYDYNEIPLYLYGFLPEDSCYYLTYEKGVLYVYNVSSETTAPDIAQALSIAYGYHYTHYYFGLDGTENDKETEYYKLRSAGCDTLKASFDSNEDYIENKEWYLFEIAANDYMYLMGSAVAQRTSRFINMAEKKVYFPNIYTALTAIYKNSLNVTPHSNLYIEMPHRVDGLAEYFYSFVEKDAPEYTIREPAGSMNMRAESKCSGSIIDIYWDTPYDDTRALYTVIAYNSSDEIVSIIQTLYGQEGGHCTYYRRIEFGVATKGFRYNYYYLHDFDEDGIKKFRVLVTFPDDTVEISDPLILN